MPLFQTSVLNKYLLEQDKELVEKQYTEFKEYFLNPAIQKNIIASKEEEFQEGFLRELFVSVLGYTINPAPDFNLRTELKNIKDSKKADGAIIDGDKVLAVIELKGTNTINLNQIEVQAFGYKNNQEGCRYIITSNFKKIRFYIDNAIDFLEWDLFTLDIEGFKILHICLQKENLFRNIAATIKLESVTVEDNVTKKLYKEYSYFRKSLFNNIVEHNPSIDKLLLFKKTQKLLDRFLFLFFAEDRMLVPPNSVRVILDQWTTLKDMDAYQPLYNRFKLYFGYLNTGHKGKVHDIFAYNGGLFAEDEILDNVKVDDSVLYDATLSLSKYDYNTEVDVNILGHIFEHSLTEIEELEQEITSIVIGGSDRISKRKKDGVFYTPKYITKYIVENTVGTLCKNKKEELNLQEEDFHKLTKKTKKQLYNNLMQYREWLLHITIIDPACGSGAFLNQALEFLITEHKWIAELEANIFNDPMVFDVESSILENNIFGVDINEESVEIAKLSLWLRTARKGRKLNSLNNNIKCGNSLVDDANVAGDKAFNWQEQFPQIFDKGGFDVVIGNPPYVRQELFKDIKPYLEKEYTCYNSIADLYTYFIEKGINILKPLGYFSFILPNKFLKAAYGKSIRNIIKERTSIQTIFDFDDFPVFSEASTYPLIYILQNKQKSETDFFYYSEINKKNIISNPIELLESNKFKIPFMSLNDEMWNFINRNSSNLLNKIQSNSFTLNEYVNKQIYRGLTTGKNEAFIIDYIKKDFLEIKNHRNKEVIKKLATGKEVKRYSFNFLDKYLLFTNYDNNIPLNYPDIMDELDKFKEDLIKRYDKGLNYWNLRACAYYKEMQMPKIIYPRINNESNFYLDSTGEIFLLDNNFFISTDSKSLLALLNSKLIFYYLKNICTTLQGGFYDFRRDKISTIPVHKNLNELEQPLSELSNTQLSNNIELQQVNTQFQKLLSSKFETININTKLEKWYTLSFADFNKELTKQKIKLTLQEEKEWLNFFEQEKTRALAIKNEINKTDIEIDRMVYELYGLTEEEIKIIERK